MHHRRLSILVLVLALGLPASAADSADAARAPYRDAGMMRTRAGELAMAAHDLTARERHHIGPLSVREIELLSEETPGGPLRVGVTRHFTQPLELRDTSLSPTRAAKVSFGGGLLRRESDGSTTWTLAVNSAAAHALRIHFDRFVLPEGAKAFVYSDEGEVHGPYTNESVTKIVPDGRDFWTNSIHTSTAYLEVRFQGATSPLDLSIDAVAHLEFPPVEASSELIANPEGTECFVDIACASGDAVLLGHLSNAVARVQFVKGGSTFVCTGSLVNVDTTSEFEPYMLTANHCFDSQASASSLEAFWDYKPASCGASAPSLVSRPRNLGATLLASAKESDFTFIQLLEAPPGTRSYLGWEGNSSAVTNGMSFHRVAHPQGGPQRYSTSTYQSSPTAGVCTSLPLTSFLYSKGVLGGTTGGSSGAPMTNSSAQILGQLYGKCGIDISNPCDHSLQAAVDGALSATYPQIEQWLNPPTGPTEPCSSSSTTLCTHSNRFRITLSARDPRTGKTDAGYVMNSTDVFGYFAFPVLAGNQTDPQIFIKVLDGRPINNKWWVFYASLTDVEFTLTVTDTQTGAVKRYSQAPYTQKSANDTKAFN